MAFIRSGQVAFNSLDDAAGARRETTQNLLRRASRTATARKAMHAGSFGGIALSLAACGGEDGLFLPTTPVSPSPLPTRPATGSVTPVLPSTFSGVVIDGYIKNAIVFVDTNGNGRQDQGEISTNTNDLGGYTLPTGALGNLLSVGGIDISTNLPFNATLSAPQGSTVLTSLTTVVNSLVAAGQDTATAKASVASALGLPSGFDVTAFDPLIAAVDPNATAAQRQAALEVHKIAANVAVILSQAGAIGGLPSSAGANTASTTAADALAALIRGTTTGQRLDLTNTVSLDAVFTAVGTALGGAEQVRLDQVKAQLINITLQTTEAIERVPVDVANVVNTLNGVAKVQVVALGGASAAMSQAVQTGDATSAVAAFTGTALTSAIDAAQAFILANGIQAPITVVTPPTIPNPGPGPAPNPTPTNAAPTAVLLNNQVTSRDENSSSTAAVKVADIVITDDALGTNSITLTGADAASFEVVGSELRLKANIALNFEAKPSYAVTVNVTDTSLAGSTPVTATYTLTVNDVNEAPTAVMLNSLVVSRDENSSSTTAVKVADIAIIDDALGTETITLTGADAASFEVVGTELRLKAGIALNFEAIPSYSVTVNVADASIAGSTPVTENYTLMVTDVNEAPDISSFSFDPTGVTFLATDADQPTQTLTYPANTFSGAVNNGTSTILTAVQQSTAILSARLQVTDGALTSNQGPRIIFGTGTSETLTASEAGVSAGIWGFGGNDTLVGNSASDFLSGGQGNDQLTGGLGVDRFYTDGGTDTITDLGQGGADAIIVGGGTVNAFVHTAYTAAATTANSGTVNISTAGIAVNLASANGPNGYSITNTSATGTTLTGSGFKDTITGGTGADAMTGGIGNDTFVINSQSATRDFMAFSLSNTTNANIDHITDFTGNGIAAGDRISLSTAANAFAGPTVTSTLQFVATGTTGATEAIVSSISVGGFTGDFTFQQLQGLFGFGTPSTSQVAQVLDITVGNGSLAGRYLVINDDVAAIDFTEDTIINITGVIGSIDRSDIIFA